MQVMAVPVKALERAKTRLAPILTPAERAALTLAMLEDVLDASLALPGWDTWVISPPGPVLDLAAGRGARPLRERGDSLWQAVRQVEAEIQQAEADLRRSEMGPGHGNPPVPALAVVLADLPLVTGAALASVLAPDQAAVVVAPARSDGGTNVLVRWPPSAIRARFGRSSCAKHRAEAYRQGVTFKEAPLPELVFDLDRPDDLADLIGSDHRSRTATACLEMELGPRLLKMGIGPTLHQQA